MPINQQEVMISTPDGEMPAFLAIPANNQIKPAVIVLMEAFGLTHHIFDVTLRIANEGYVAIAPDLYYRTLPNNKFGYDQVKSARSMMYDLSFANTVDQDIKAVIDYLKCRQDVHADCIGVTGFCFGGSMAFYTATRLSEDAWQELKGFLQQYLQNSK